MGSLQKSHCQLFFENGCHMCVYMIYTHLDWLPYYTRELMWMYLQHFQTCKNYNIDI